MQQIGILRIFHCISLTGSLVLGKMIQQLSIRCVVPTPLGQLMWIRGIHGSNGLKGQWHRIQTFTTMGINVDHNLAQDCFLALPSQKSDPGFVSFDAQMQTDTQSMPLRTLCTSKKEA